MELDAKGTTMFKKTLLLGFASAALFAGSATAAPANFADPGVGAGAANPADPSGGGAQAQVVDPGGSSVSYTVKRSLKHK
jgi:hypothetical protein